MQIAEIVQNAIWNQTEYSMMHDNVMPAENELSKRKIIAWFDGDFKQNQFNRRKKYHEKHLRQLNMILINWSPPIGDNQHHRPGIHM